MSVEQTGLLVSCEERCDLLTNFVQIVNIDLHCCICERFAEVALQLTLQFS